MQLDTAANHAIITVPANALKGLSQQKLVKNARLCKKSQNKNAVFRLA